MCFWRRKKNKETKDVQPVVVEEVEVKEEVEPQKEKKTTKKTAKKTVKEEKTETAKKEKTTKKAETKKAVKEEKPAKTTKKAQKVEEKPAKTTKKTQKTEEKKEEKVDDKQSKKPVYRVLYDKEERLWKIKKDGASRVIDSRKTKEEALARVQELSGNQDINFVVHKKDGKFQNKDNLNLKKTK